MSYAVFIERRAQRTLSRITKLDQDRIAAAIPRRLADDPRPHSVKKLTGREAWRIRVGDYRILYEIHDDRLVVLVVEIGHRRQIYRK